MSSRSSSRSRNNPIDKLDFDGHRKPTSVHDDSGMSSPNGLLRDDESLLSHVVEGVIERDRRKMRRAVTKYLSFACATLNCLCAGSIIAYSLYGHLFQSHLRYTQYQVNVVSITAELAMYLPVPLFGYLCDRFSPRPLSLFAAFCFGFGYLLAAFAYHRGPPVDKGGHGWPVGVMVLAFVPIGMGTASMYLSAVTTCAKNFGRGKHKGLALTIPIASFGLSGMWQSQVGSQLLYERMPDGTKGDVDVFRYFLFLAGTLFGVGLIGSIALRVVNEEELIDDAVEELERSGLLEDSEFFQRSILHDANSNGYGTLTPQRRHSGSSEGLPRPSSKAQQNVDSQKKTWLLNSETRRFLSDPTMWFLTAGFFLVTGPGEAFVNNLGTIIGTLYPPPASAPPVNSAATNITIIAIASTLARLLMGTLSDFLAPRSASSDNIKTSFAVSRLAFLLFSTSLLVLSQILLAAGAIESRPSYFTLVSALVGAGYGSVFSLIPIIVSVVWGVQNFATNWGIVAVVPAAGAAIWGAVYSAVYQDGASRSGGQEELCWGKQCYQTTFWAMAVTSVVGIVLWAWAWRGRGGWKARGVLV